MTFQLPSRNNYHHLDDAPIDNPYDITSHSSHSHTDSITEPPGQIHMHSHTDSITEYTNENTTDPAQTTLLNHNYDHDYDLEKIEATRPLQAHLAHSGSYLPPPTTQPFLTNPVFSPTERFERALAESERGDYMRVRPKGLRMYSLANTKIEWHHGSKGRVLKYWVGFPLLGAFVIVVVVIIVLGILGFSKIGITQ